jgi:type I restriction enzyme S subunit
LVDSLSYFGKQIFSQNLSTYKIVKRGQFAYATNHIEEGSIGYQNLHDEALISPMYTVFQTNSEIDDSFLYKLLKTETYRHIFEAMTSGSINRRGSLRWNHFAQIKLKLPSLEEQKKIAAVLKSCDAEINVLQSKLNAIRQQKRGLMQKLLTGKVRIKTEPEKEIKKEYAV